MIEYLQKNSTADAFVDSAFQMVGQSIEAYLEVGYTHLMICFGCTGGQHRSVYCAEALSHRIKEHFDVLVSTIHREQPQLDSDKSV